MNKNCHICSYSKSQSLSDPNQNTYHCSVCNKSWFKGKRGKGIEFFTCKHCGKPFKQLRTWKEGLIPTFALRYTPILANHLRNSHGEIYAQYKVKPNNLHPQGRELEKLERENAQLVKDTEREYRKLRESYER